MCTRKFKEKVSLHIVITMQTGKRWNIPPAILVKEGRNLIISSPEKSNNAQKFHN